ncbi:MAG: 16S rRNA (cytosine(967)-C(5))-methyltransferase RsmB [Myxococcales bacterium]|nr:16S rRNA (cytosine(967)-C(5))-methyltransferase RsmB [Myxococcales bacterium]
MSEQAIQPKRRKGTPTSGRAREVALNTLQALEEEDAFLQPALERFARRANLDARDRGLALELVMGVERLRLRLDHSLEALVNRGMANTPAPLQRILRLAAYQILFLDRIPPHAAVNEAVEQARLAVGPGASRMVNGVLRNLLRDGEAPPPEGERVPDVVIRTSHPKWMVQRWFSQGGPRLALERGRANNRPAPLTVRVDARDLDRDGLMARLQAEGATVRPCRIAPDGVVIERHGGAPFKSASFLEGQWRAQDEASQLIVELLDPQPGEAVWDVCAAPGGKTRAIARRMGDTGMVLATDVNPAKVERLAHDLDDLGSAQARQLDATQPLDGPPPFDRVMLDAPCTALGTVRRHPEIKWRRSPRDPAKKAEVQAALLEAVCRGVKPGGVLVYSVCTDTDEETHGVIVPFLEAHPEFEIEVPGPGTRVNWRRLSSKRGFVRLSPERHDTDGFFAVRLRRKAEGEVAEPAAAPASEEAPAPTPEETP